MEIDKQRLRDITTTYGGPRDDHDVNAGVFFPYLYMFANPETSPSCIGKCFLKHDRSHEVGSERLVDLKHLHIFLF